MQSAAAAGIHMPSGTGDPAILLRRVSLSGSCTTGVLLLLFLAPDYRLPAGIAPNVILTFFLPLGFILTSVSYEMTSRYLCNWAEAAFTVGFREAVGERFRRAAGYKPYRSFRGSFLSDPSAPETLRSELARSRDIRKQIAYVTATCGVILPVAAFVALVSAHRREAALDLAVITLLLTLCTIVAFRVRSITLGRAYGLAYEWAVRNKRLAGYAGTPSRRLTIS
jgi:hypothetical protein